MSERRKQTRISTLELADAPLDWSALVALLIHPTKVLVIEAMRWIERPLAASELSRVFDDDEGLDLSTISYHVRTLAKVGVLTQVKVKPVRGGKKRIYTFSGAVRRQEFLGSRR
jgi:DNA-binding transcriptional ArsR family regulator